MIRSHAESNSCCFLCRFSFAETDSLEQIEKAKETMEGVKIEEGRRLRVRRLVYFLVNKLEITFPFSVLRTQTK